MRLPSVELERVTRLVVGRGFSKFEMVMVFPRPIARWLPTKRSSSIRCLSIGLTGHDFSIGPTGGAHVGAVVMNGCHVGVGQDASYRGKIQKGFT